MYLIPPSQITSSLKRVKYTNEKDLLYSMGKKGLDLYLLSTNIVY